MTLAENLEVLNLRAIAGEFDMQERHLDIGKLPVFIENQQKGNYKLSLDVGDYGSDLMYKFNLSYEAVDLRLSYELTDWLRAYGGVGYIVRKEPSDLEPWWTQMGVEVRSPVTFLGGTLRPLAALDVPRIRGHPRDSLAPLVERCPATDHGAREGVLDDLARASDRRARHPDVLDARAARDQPIGAGGKVEHALDR